MSVVLPYRVTGNLLSPAGGQLLGLNNSESGKATLKLRSTDRISGIRGAFPMVTEIPKLVLALSPEHGQAGNLSTVGHRRMVLPGPPSL